jgi:competence protein ComEA
VLAGGARPGADLVAVNLAAHLSDGDEIVVPKIGEEPPPSARARRRPGASPGHRSSGRRHRKHRASADGVPPSGMVDLNAADAATLATVPGIGPGIAERIVAFRTANGPFASVDELLDVSGITDRRLDAILPYVVAR